MTYELNTAEIVKITDIPESDIFNYEDSPHKSEFNKTFEFYKTMLHSKSIEFNVSKSYFYFKYDTSKNANAGYINEHGVIAINAGLLIWVIQNIKDNDFLHQFMAEKYGEIIGRFDNTVNELMYQFSLHFTFYHEFAHLIQHSSKSTFTLNERPEDVKYDIQKHKREIDADSFSTACLVGHLEVYLDTIFGDGYSVDELQCILEIFGTAAMIYIRTYSPYNEPIYYDSKTHPHAIIRLLNVVISVINNFQNNSVVIEKGIVFNPVETFKTILSYTEVIEKECFNVELDKSLLEVFRDERIKILSHFKYIESTIPDNYQLAVDVWSEYVDNSN